MSSFADLNLHERLIKALGELEITTPTPVQASAIPEALAGHDLRVVARTGSGKTAAFLITIINDLLRHPITVPRYAGDPRALTVAPTRAPARPVPSTHLTPPTGRPSRLHVVRLHSNQNTT